MQVSICLRQEDVLITPAVASPGDSPATIKWVTVGPDQWLGDVPYAALRELGDGLHDLAIEEGAFPAAAGRARAPAGNVSRGWPVSGIVFILVAAIAYVVFASLLRFAQSLGAHPAVIGSYRWGGTVVIPALLAGAGCLLVARGLGRSVRV